MVCAVLYYSRVILRLSSGRPDTVPRDSYNWGVGTNVRNGFNYREVICDLVVCSYTLALCLGPLSRLMTRPMVRIYDSHS